ncbi:MAG: hypothetical protein ACYCQI_17045 [Gammaproteobacteria bacterium]
MKKMSEKIVAFLNSPFVLCIGKVAFILGLIFISRSVFATDVLAGTDTDIKDTLSGTGRHYVLYIDGVAAALMFATRKNIVVLGSIFVITLFMNLLLFLAK